MSQHRAVLGAVGGLALAALASVAWTANAASAQGTDKSDKKQPVLRLRAFAVDTNRPGVASNRTLYIVIERWSTDAERDNLLKVLEEKGGGDALLSAIQKIKPRVGYVRSATSVGWDLQFARERVMPDGTRRIIVASDRPMSFWEAANRPRSADYEFLAAEIHLDKTGKGEGKLIPAAAIDYDKDTRTIEVENYETYPVNLLQVEVEK